jgi:hypothetical protein
MTSIWTPKKKRLAEEASKAVEQSMSKYFCDWFNHTFPYCYGSGEAPIIDAIKSFFETMSEKTTYDHEKLETVLGFSSAWLLINTLNAADIFTYGTSPRYGFFTDKGLKLRDFVSAKTTEELYEIVQSDWGEDGIKDTYGCTPSYCNCGPEQVMKKCANPLF